MMPKRICLFGGPNAGKSVLAAELFAELKKRGYKIELVTEYIKLWAWQKLKPTSWDQFYILAKQIHNEDVILRNGGHIITDVPLWLIYTYCKWWKTDYTSDLAPLIETFDRQYPNTINIFINREDLPYKDEGRYHTKQEAEDIDYETWITICDHVYHTRGCYTYNHKVKDSMSKLLEFVISKLETEDEKAKVRAEELETTWQ